MDIDEGPVDSHHYDRFAPEDELEEGEMLMMGDSRECLRERLIDTDFFNGFEDDLRDPVPR